MKHDPQEGEQHDPEHDPESSLEQQAPAQAAPFEDKITSTKCSLGPRFAGVSKLSGSSRRREAIVRAGRVQFLEDYLTRVEEVDSRLGLT